ncbi:MAG: Asd/ArgC dimerization domain-containing protein, partial [Bacteroidales bacterium]
IDLNLFPFGGTLESNGYTSEETKLVNETRKILRDKNIQVTATVVRVPVMGGHSESINIEFENEYDLKDIDRLLKEMPGITVLDDPARHEYPMPFFVKDKDEVFVGRIRRDDSQPKSLNIWVVADNLRKGAATNAVQIATLLCQQGLVKS